MDNIEIWICSGTSLCPMGRYLAVELYPPCGKRRVLEVRIKTPRLHFYFF